MASFHDDFESRLLDWIDGRMNAKQRIRFERELMDDPQKAEVAEAWRRINDKLRRLDEDILDDAVPERMLAAVKGLPHNGDNTDGSR